MPVCEISYTEGLFSPKEEKQIVEKITKLLLKVESLPDNQISRSICYVNLIESKKMYIGGDLSKKGKILIKIYSFHDAFTDDIKKEIYFSVKDIFVEENSFSKESNGNNIWCIINPIEELNFGVGGIPVNLNIVQNLTSKR
ncbi:MAG: tautomerase family protein [Smithellaceae bacterium]|nr:tautomerase family protein [Smithellaceae bacterium]